MIGTSGFSGAGSVARRGAGWIAAVCMAGGLASPASADDFGAATLGAPETVIAAGSDAARLSQPAPASVARWAATYIDFRTDIDRLDAMDLRSANETREAHRLLGTHDPYKLAEGWMAYAALVAADTPAFSKALRKELRRSNRDKVLTKIAQNPDYIFDLPGARSAVQSVLQVATADSAKMAIVGEKFRARSYEMQETSWGVKPTRDQQERLAKIRDEARARRPKAVAAAGGGLNAPILASAGGDWSAAWAGGKNARTSDFRLSGPAARAAMNQILILAAQHSLGATEGVNAEQARMLLRSDKSRQCYNWAKLHLDQCIAATRAPYEEAYCLGRHGLDDVAECVGWVAASAG